MFAVCMGTVVCELVDIKRFASIMFVYMLLVCTMTVYVISIDSKKGLNIRQHYGYGLHYHFVMQDTRCNLVETQIGVSGNDGAGLFPHL